MGILDSLRAAIQSAIQIPTEPVVGIENSGDEEEATESADDFMARLRAERKEATRPAIKMEDVASRFYAYNGNKFDFSSVPVYSFEGGAWYLLDGANADKIIDDMSDLDTVLKGASEIAELPDFTFPVMDILLEPEWIERGYEMGWKMSHIYPSTFTKTGKIPKYAFTVRLESRSGRYGATVKYLQNDTIGNAEVRVFSDGSLYVVTVRENEIIRIMRCQNGENFPMYASL